MSRRALIYGDFREYRLAASYERAMAALGWEVFSFDTWGERHRLSWWLRNRWTHRLTVKSAAARRVGCNAYSAAFQRRIRETKPDLVFILNGELLWPDSIAAAKASGARVAIFHPDNPLPGNYANRPETLPLAREADVYLVWSDELVRELRSRGFGKAHFMPFGWDPEAFPYHPPATPKDFDVAFVGGWDPAREELLNKVAARFPLRIWGPPYWDTRTSRGGVCRGRWQGHELAPTAAAEVISRAKITLNVLRDQHVIGGRPDGVIMRTFEVPGAGGFLLSTRTPTAVRLFPEREAGAYFGGAAECVEMIDFYLADDALRNRIAQTAHALVEGQHRYENRVRELVELVG